MTELATRPQRAEADARLEELALKAAAGDQVALEQAFALTLGIARRYCASRIDPPLQDDVVQEICLAALRALPRYRSAIAKMRTAIGSAA